MMEPARTAFMLFIQTVLRVLRVLLLRSLRSTFVDLKFAERVMDANSFEQPDQPA